jgi:hypothetical protein
MNKADKYRAHVRHCVAMAAQAQRVEYKQSWLLMAETWLRMIPERRQTAADRFDVGRELSDH